MSLTARLAALRMARREVRRARGRSALVMALVGLPVAALAFGAVTYDSFQPTPEETADRLMGNADAVVQMQYDVPVTQPPGHLFGTPADDGTKPRPHPRRDLLAVLPDGTTLHPDHTDTAKVRTRYGTTTLSTRGLDYRHTVAKGIIEQLEGRAPATEREVVLSSAAAEHLGVRTGDDLVLVRPEAARYRVVGLVEEPTRLAHQFAIFQPDALPEGPGRESQWLAETPRPLTWPDVRDLNRHGMVAVSRAVLLDPPPSGLGDDTTEELGLGSLVVGMAILEIVLLAGPAFAISARRRQRELALVSAAGGSPAQVRWIVLADGVVLGGLGGLAGVALGVLAAVASIPLLEEHLMGQRIGGLRVFPLALAGICGLAVLTGLLAALIPAVSVARQNVVASLSGRRGITRSRRRWIVLGLAASVTGVGLAFLGGGANSSGPVLGGLVMIQLGLAVCMPALIGAVARLSGRLPLAARIAIRTTGRNRSAAAPAVAAVMAAVAAAVTVAAVINSDAQRQAADYRPGIPDGYVGVRLDPSDPEPTRTTEAVERTFRRTMPVTDVRTVRTVDCGEDMAVCGLEAMLPAAQQCPQQDVNVTEAEWRRYQNDPRCRETTGWTEFETPSPVVDDGSVIAALTGADRADVAAATRTLARGGVVVGHRRYVEDGMTTLSATRAEEQGDPVRPDTLKVRAYVLRTGVAADNLLVVGNQLAGRFDMGSEPLAVVAATSRAPTTEEQDAANEGVARAGIDNGTESPVYVEQGPPVDADPYLLLLAGIAGLVMLGASAIATGLVLSDSRGELSTLAAVGAAPGLRRRLTLAQSGVIAGLGGLVGGVVGIGAATAVLLAMNRELAVQEPGTQAYYPYLVPWLVLGITVVVVPLVAMLCAGLLTRSKLPIERRLT